MMADTARFDNLDVYSQKMLADGAGLTLARFKRTSHIEELDKNRLVQLINLFDDAIEADRAILGAQMASASDKSVSILSMVTEAMARLTLADAVRTVIQQLKSITEQVVDGIPLDENDHQKLTTFLRQYSLYQEDRLRRLRSEMGMGGDIWPESTRMTSL